MKKILLLAGVAFAMSSCNRTELVKADQKNDSLISVINQRDSIVGNRDASINDFIGAFNDVERNLNAVAVRQHVIAVNTDQAGELKKNQKDHINAEIEAINKLMDQNRSKLSELNRKLKNSSGKNADLEKTIATITVQLNQKDIELTSLNEKLNYLNSQVAELQTSVTTLKVEGDAKSQKINETTKALHTAYYVVGKSKDLRNENLIDKKGGILGIGSTPKMKSDVDNSKFKLIDYTETTSIAVNSNDVKIITNHPPDSYKMDTDEKDKKIIKNIIITNPEKFWSESKYLVIVKG